MVGRWGKRDRQAEQSRLFWRLEAGGLRSEIGSRLDSSEATIMEFRVTSSGAAMIPANLEVGGQRLEARNIFSTSNFKLLTSSHSRPEASLNAVRDGIRERAESTCRNSSRRSDVGNRNSGRAARKIEAGGRRLEIGGRKPENLFCVGGCRFRYFLMGKVLKA